MVETMVENRDDKDWFRETIAMKRTFFSMIDKLWESETMRLESRNLREWDLRVETWESETEEIVLLISGRLGEGEGKFMACLEVKKRRGSWVKGERVIQLLYLEVF